MAFTCGFFNSVNGDRKYNAEEMNNPYYRIVSNGIFANEDGTESTDFLVTKDTIGTVKVTKGDGIFFDKWAKLDGDLTLAMYTPHSVYSRIDSVVIRVDKSDDVRAGSIVIKKGVPASTPTAPEIERTSTVKEYRLADILIPANATAVSQITITDQRSSSDCGWITALIYQPSVARVYTGAYTTTTADEDTIEVPITSYNPVVDSLLVYINGLLLTSNVDYTKSGRTVILTKAVDINTPINFVCFKAE